MYSNRKVETDFAIRMKRIREKEYDQRTFYHYNVVQCTISTQ